MYSFGHSRCGIFVPQVGFCLRSLIALSMNSYIFLSSYLPSFSSSNSVSVFLFMNVT